MKQYKVGVVGATGMVGQRFVTLLAQHPWFHITALAASARSAGQTYEKAVGSRWAMQTPMPDSVKDMVVMDAADVQAVADKVDFVFCAVNMKKDEIKALEEAYAKAECPVVSNNSAHRFTPDVPMVVPEINADHIEIIPAQRKRLGTRRGFIAVKSNCSLQSYVPALHPLKKYGLDKILVCNPGGPQFNEGSIRGYVRRHIPPGSCRNIYIIFRDSGQILIGPGSGLQRKLYRFLHLQGHQEFLQQIPSAGPSL